MLEFANIFVSHLQLCIYEHLYLRPFQVTLTFVVYDWDGPLVGDDLLGVAKLSLSQVCTYVALVFHGISN